jgi:hypothetical protein
VETTAHIIKYHLELTWEMSPVGLPIVSNTKKVSAASQFSFVRPSAEARNVKRAAIACFKANTSVGRLAIAPYTS